MGCSSRANPKDQKSNYHLVDICLMSDVKVSYSEASLLLLWEKPSSATDPSLTTVSVFIHLQLHGQNLQDSISPLALSFNRISIAAIVHY